MTSDFSLERDSIRSGLTLHTTSKEGWWEAKAPLPERDGLEWGRTLEPIANNSRGGLIGVTSRFEFVKNFGSLPDLSDKFSSLVTQAREKVEQHDPVEAFFHEAGAHAGRHTRDLPDIHGVQAVDDLAGDVELFFHPAPPQNFGESRTFTPSP